MTDHYTAAVEGQQAANEAFDHGTKMIAFANAQLNATLAVADLLREGQQGAHEMYDRVVADVERAMRAEAEAQEFARTERQLDAETKEMFTVHPDDRDRERAEAAEHERVAAAQAAWEAMWTKVYSAINTYCDAEDSDLDAADSARNELADVITNVLTNGGEGERAGAPVEDRGHGTRHNAVMTALAPYDHAGDTTPLSDIADEILAALDRVDSSPRIWALPAAPGPAVTAVRDDDGDIWHRINGQWVIDGGSSAAWHGLNRSWTKLVVQFGPLTEVTEDGAR